jgi:AraC-like DNA-binding protein
LNSFGIWGYGLRSSPTLGEAVKLALRFIRLTYAFSLISLYQTKTHVILTFGEPNLNADLTRFLVERDMIAAVGLLHELAGPHLKLENVSFRFKALGTEKEILAGIGGSGHVSGIKAEFGARLNSITIPRDYFELVLPNSDPTMVAVVEKMCSDLLERRRLGISISQQVKQYLRVPGMDIPDQPTMAQLMSMSERTLKRRLAAEGTSFREISGAVRRTMAADLLKRSQHSISEVGVRLGFSDLSSFSQAFKRWYNCSPQQFRIQNDPLTTRTASVDSAAP